MPRAKRGNKRTEKRKKILKLAKGYRGNKSKLYRYASEAVDRALNFAYTGSQVEEARLPQPVDRAYRRGGALERLELFAVHARLESRRDRTRPQSLS